MLHWLKPSSIEYPQKGRAASLVFHMAGRGRHHELT